MGTYTGSDKRLQYLFQNGGGGGGSTVTITPTLSSGTKIADYSINGVGGELFAPSGGGISDDWTATEQIVGSWLGKVKYRRVFDLGADTNIQSNAWYYSSGISISNLSSIVRCFGVNSSGTYYPLMAFHSSGAVNLLACRDGNPANVRYVALEYTKTV